MPGYWLVPLPVEASRYKGLLKVKEGERKRVLKVKARGQKIDDH